MEVEKEEETRAFLGGAMEGEKNLVGGDMWDRQR